MISPTPEQLRHAQTMTMTLEAIQDICFREILQGRGRDFSLPMIRAAVDELEQKFIQSPQFRDTNSKTEKN